MDDKKTLMLTEKIGNINLNINMYDCDVSVGSNPTEYRDQKDRIRKLLINAFLAKELIKSSMIHRGVVQNEQEFLDGYEQYERERYEQCEQCEEKEVSQELQLIPAIINIINDKLYYYLINKQNELKSKYIFISSNLLSKFDIDYYSDIIKDNKYSIISTDNSTNKSFLIIDNRKQFNSKHGVLIELN